MSANPNQIRPKDRIEIDEILRGGVQQVRVVLRALALRELGRGVTAPHVAQTLPLTAKAIRQIAHRYDSGGLERALYDQPRPGPAQLLDDAQKQRIVAMVCSDPPEGRARWTVRLVAEEAVKRKLGPKMGSGSTSNRSLSHAAQAGLIGRVHVPVRPENCDASLLGRRHSNRNERSLGHRDVPEADGRAQLASIAASIGTRAEELVKNAFRAAVGEGVAQANRAAGHQPRRPAWSSPHRGCTEPGLKTA